MAERDRHVSNARVSQILRMCMALASIANDGDLLALDQVLIRVTVIINLHSDILLR
jgi:hypothetical protein